MFWVSGEHLQLSQLWEFLKLVQLLQRLLITSGERGSESLTVLHLKNMWQKALWIDQISPLWIGQKKKKIRFLFICLFLLFFKQCYVRVYQWNVFALSLKRNGLASLVLPNAKAQTSAFLELICVMVTMIVEIWVMRALLTVVSW